MKHEWVKIEDEDIPGIVKNKEVCARCGVMKHTATKMHLNECILTRNNKGSCSVCGEHMSYYASKGVHYVDGSFVCPKHMTDMHWYYTDG